VHFDVQVVNPTVGDAMSVLLLVLGILCGKHFGVRKWVSMYEVMPSRLVVVKVMDRHVLETEAMETRLRQPLALQSAIDQLTASVPGGRVFVRPSGTEDVVRVYAEALKQDACDALCLKVLQAVHDFAGGVGAKPTAV
jgi:phosphoacetylglucosamine mutase